jgi:hypothetical protein
VEQIEPLTAGEKMDLSPFMPKIPQMPGMDAPVVSWKKWS